MSKYAELRSGFRDPPIARAARTRREMLATLAAAGAGLDTLVAASVSQLQDVFGARSDELIEIARESAANLRGLLEAMPPDGASIADAAAIRDLRHDLRGPVGTLRGAVVMLARRVSHPAEGLALAAVALVQAAEDLRDIVDALLEDEPRL